MYVPYEQRHCNRRLVLYDAASYCSVMRKSWCDGSHDSPLSFGWRYCGSNCADENGGGDGGGVNYGQNGDDHALHYSNWDLAFADFGFVSRIPRAMTNAAAESGGRIDVQAVELLNFEVPSQRCIGYCSFEMILDV